MLSTINFLLSVVLFVPYLYLEAWCFLKCWDLLIKPLFDMNCMFSKAQIVAIMFMGIVLIAFCKSVSKKDQDKSNDDKTFRISMTIIKTPFVVFNCIYLAYLLRFFII